MTIHDFLGCYGTTNKELISQCDVSPSYFFSYITDLKKAGVIAPFNPFLFEQPEKATNSWGQTETKLITKAIEYGKSGVKKPEAIRKAITDIYGEKSAQYENYKAFQIASRKEKVKKTAAIRKDIRTAEIESLSEEFLGPAVDMVIHAIRSNPYVAMTDSIYEGERLSDSAIEAIDEGLLAALQKDITMYVSSHRLQENIETYKNQLLKSLYKQWVKEVCSQVYGSGFKNYLNEAMKAALEQDEIDILTEHFGLIGKKDVLENIGKKRGVGRAAIEIRENKALEKLGRYLAEEETVHTLKPRSVGSRLYRNGITTKEQARTLGEFGLKRLGFGKYYITKVSDALRKQGLILRKDVRTTIESTQELEISGHTFYALLRSNEEYRNVDAVTGLTRKQAENLPGIGKKRADEIENALRIHGLSFREDVAKTG